MSRVPNVKYLPINGRLANIILPGAVVYALWTGIPDCPILIVNPSSGLINNFGSYYFKQDFIFSESKATKTSKGTILFGTNKGILEINPSTMSESNYAPPLVLTEIKLNNHAVSAPINQLEKLELKPNQRNFSIQFSALDFNNSKEIEKNIISIISSEKDEFAVQEKLFKKYHSTIEKLRSDLIAIQKEYNV